MKLDQFGILHRTSDELYKLLYNNPELDLHTTKIDDPDTFNRSIKELFYDFKPLDRYVKMGISVEEFDAKNHATWFMPDKYKNLDIAQWVLDRCKTDEEIQRAGTELIMFQDRNLLPLLQFMLYFVETLRAHDVVWGVGRGSSVASYVLYLIGVHRVNSMQYELPIEEFLK